MPQVIPASLFDVANAVGTDGAALVSEGPGTIPKFDPNNFWDAVNRQRKLIGQPVGTGGDRWNCQDDAGNDLHHIDRYGTLTGRATGAPIVLSATVASVALTANVATINTAAAHGFRPADLAVVSGLTTTALNGSWVVVTTPTATSFTFTLNHANIAPTADAGSAVVTRSAPIHIFRDEAGNACGWVDKRGGMTFAKDLPGPPSRFGDDASIAIHQSQNGVLGDDVAFAVYDVNYRWTATATSPALYIQAYFLADGSFLTGRHITSSQDRSKPSGAICTIGPWPYMIGASSDVNGPCFIAQNQRNIPGEPYRLCFVTVDAADLHPSTPAGGIWSDRGVGKHKFAIGEKGELYWSPFLNPDGPASDPELTRSAKQWFNTTTNHLTISGSGVVGSTTYFDVQGPTNGNAVFRMGGNGNQDAFSIYTAGASAGIVQFVQKNIAFFNVYDSAPSTPSGGLAIGVGVDDNTSLMTLNGGRNHASVPVLTVRGGNGATGDLFHVQTYDSPNVYRNRFRVLSTGQLEVVKSAGGTLLSLGANNTTGILDVSYDVDVGGDSTIDGSPFGPLQLRSRSNFDINLKPNGTGRILLQNKVLFGASSAYDSTNVRFGIGTQSPSAPLHINRPGSQDFILVQATDTNYANIKIAVSSTQAVMGADSAHGYFRTVTNHPFAISTNNSRRLWMEAAAGLTSLGVYAFSVPGYTQDCRLQLDCSTATEPGFAIAGTTSQTAPLMYLRQRSSTANRNAAVIDAALPVTTDASRTGRLTLSAVDFAATREGVRIEANGTQVLLGFYGATATAKPTATGSRGGNAALASLLTALASLGLLTDSTTA